MAIQWDKDEKVGFYTDERDGNEYLLVKIGNQVWFAENFRYLPYIMPFNKKQCDAIDVPRFSGSSVDDAKSNVYYKSYGAVYSWCAANDLCPDGWRLPTFDDWMELAENMGYPFTEDESYFPDFLLIKYGYWEYLWKDMNAATHDWPAQYRGDDDFGFGALPALHGEEGYSEMAGWWTGSGLIETFRESDERFFDAMMDDPNEIRNALNTFDKYCVVFKAPLYFIIPTVLTTKLSVRYIKCM